MTPDPCDGCGEDSDGGFVKYEPAPNDAQAEKPWGPDLPTLRAIVCIGCGHISAVFDPEDIDQDRPPAADDFRVEGELE